MSEVLNVKVSNILVGLSDDRWPHCLNSTGSKEFKFRDDMATDDDTRWRTVSHVFSDYGPGMRYVNIMHGGCAEDMEDGWFGSTMKNTSVIVKYPKTNTQSIEVSQDSSQGGISKALHQISITFN